MKKSKAPRPCEKPLYNINACLTCHRSHCPNDYYDEVKEKTAKKKKKRKRGKDHGGFEY